MLALDHVSRRFDDLLAVDDVSLRLAPGSILGFVGPNGSGKTTTMRIALGLLTPDSGSVSYGDGPVGERERQRIGYMPEERGLYPKMRLDEQLAYLARLHGRGRADAAASAAAWLERLGLAERRADRLEQLSLGNQQRVQLAAALVHDPEVLVLDEPFSGLDPIGADVMAAVLRERADAGVAVLFSSHQLELVERICDRVALIARGRILVDGPIAGLLARGAQPRYVLRLASDAAPLAAVPGVTAVERRDGDVVHVELAPDADAQALLDAARRLGPVGAFAPEPRGLADVFRDLVAEHG